MQIESLEIRLRGRNTNVPSARIDSCTVIATGKWLKTAQLFDEELVEEADFPDVGRLISCLREIALPADVFTFARRVETSTPKYEFPFEWDNLAVAATTSFDNWWNGLPQESRKNIRLATKRGVIVRTVAFDDSFVRQIKGIYDETPIRQGKQFWHYHKDLESVRVMNATYLDRSHFIGAFLGDKLIGFIKYIRVDRTAVLIQIIAMDAHRDKRPIYALLRHTMELCQQQGLSVLTYGKFNYGINQHSSLTEFKRRNGFAEMRFPRYFVPLTPKGQLAVATGLHLGIRNLVPVPITTLLHKTRSHLLKMRE
jgi:hypothetical protein